MTLRYSICIYSLVEGVKKCFLESKMLPSINRYPIYKEKTFWKKTKIKHNFHWLKINEWSIKTSSCFKVEYHIFTNFLIKILGICSRTIQ